MKFLQSKKSRKLLLFIGLPLLLIAGYVGYEVYTFHVEFNKTMQGFGQVMSGVADIVEAFSRAAPDSTAVDSTQVMTDSLQIK